MQEYFVVMGLYMAKLETLEKLLKEYTTLTVKLNDFGLVIEASSGKFKNSLTVTELSGDSAYRCMGSIYLKDDWYSVELIEVSKTLKSEEELIKLLKKVILATNDLRDTVWRLEADLRDR